MQIKFLYINNSLPDYVIDSSTINTFKASFKALLENFLIDKKIHFYNFMHSFMCVCML